MRRYELTDDEWAIIEALIPAAAGIGRPRRDPREMWNAIFGVLRSGAPWRDLPERYGPWESAYAHFNSWRRQGVFERVLEALRRLRIPAADTRLRNYSHQFSGGMRQRVSSAIALSCAPRLLIADEPTTALDVTIQAQYLELLKEVQASAGVAVILVTHDFGIVAAIADRVAVMYAGRIVEMGSTLQVFDNPSHPYTRALLRCLPDVGLKREHLVEIGGQPPDLARLPPGCPFAPRCPERQPICDETYPPTVPVASGHVASCWAVPGAKARA